MAENYVGNYDESAFMPRYLLKNYPALFTHNEGRAIKVYILALKASGSSEDWEQKFADYVERLAESEAPETRALLAAGHDEFWRRACERVLREHGPSLVINRCPRCSCMVASPGARQCLWCHHDWHSTPTAST
jgi:hypothetical protein